MNLLTTSPRTFARRARWAALVLAVTTAGLVGVTPHPASAASSPTVRTAPTLSGSTVPVGQSVRVRSAPTFSGPVTRIGYAWEYCTRPQTTLICNETGVGGTRYTPTYASTGGKTLAVWASVPSYVRLRAVAYNGLAASAPTWSAPTQVVPGQARGALDLLEWWDQSTFAVYGIAAADGVDGALPFRLRALNANGSPVAIHYGQSGLFRTDYRLAWPNTGNWGGFNVALHGVSTARTLCLDVGLSYVQVTCIAVPARPPVMTGV